jgi:hypothetical protein
VGLNDLIGKRRRGIPPFHESFSFPSTLEPEQKPVGTRPGDIDQTVENLQKTGLFSNDRHPIFVQLILTLGKQ